MPNLSIILVSPLMRAVETAYYVFKDHPNFASCKFILDPVLRERCDCNCSIPNSLDCLKEKFGEKIPQIDYGLVGSDLWFLENLNVELRNIIEQQLENNPEQDYKLTTLGCLDYAKGIVESE